MKQTTYFSFQFSRQFVCIVLFSFSLIPANAQYYTSAFGKNGPTLKTALHGIIQGHTVGTYADLWADYFTTDNKGGNIVWDIYSDIPGGAPAYSYTLGPSQCGTYNSEGDCYNREHIWPATYFNDNLPMYTDLQMIYPTDGWVNNKHGNLPYGNVNTVSWTSQNGCQTGSSSAYAGSLLDVFEPIDSFKGDIARVYFYASTRYEGEDAGWLNWEMANGAELTQDAIAILLAWHHTDPVSQKEIDRNNNAFGIQGNRNPFIDYPEFADCIWGTGDCTSLSLKNVELNSQVKIYPNPATEKIYIQASEYCAISSYSLYNLVGQKIAEGLASNKPIDIQTFAAGTYMLMLNTTKGVATKLLVKE